MNRRLCAVLAAVGLCAAAAPFAHANAGGLLKDDWSPRPATYGVWVEPDVPITMHDGTVLDADIHHPACLSPDQTGGVLPPGCDGVKVGDPASGRFPTLLVQTPYNKNLQNPANDYLVQRGYVDVVVDIRGTGSSEGAFDGSFTAASQADSYELVQWAASQAWSTGKVGTHGESYYAINQLLTAVQQPPALKAIFPVVPTGDNYRSNFPGGYLTSLFVFALEDAADGLVPPNYTASDPLRAVRSMGAKVGGVELQTANVAGLLAGDDNTYDGPGYCNISPLCLIDRIKVPTFLVGGWYDALSQRDAPMLFHQLQANHVPVKLMMGPWYHVTAGSGLSEAGLNSLDELQLRWFDHWVRGDNDRGLEKIGPVIYNRLGEGGWHTAPTWPLPGVTYSNKYLGGSSTPRTIGTLGDSPPSVSAPDALPWHPASGACTRSTYVGTFGLAPPSPCESDDSSNDATGLAYELAVGEQPMNLTGPISAHLFVSTTRNDAFVTLHLEDVDPKTGAANEITGGWDSLVFREIDPAKSVRVGENYVIPFHPDTKESAANANIQPDPAVYDWWIEIRPTAGQIAAGHKLRFSIQSSDSVRFLPTGTRAAATAGSVVRVFHDTAHPSSIVLPISS